MNLGIFLSPGDSLTNFSQSGQSDRFIDYYLKPYAKEFDKVYLFSYENEKWALPSNVYLIPNKLNLHRIIYGIFLSLLQFSTVNKCDVIRGFGLASSISSFLLWKPFIFNWAYNYIEFVKIDKKYIYIPFYFFLEKLAFGKAQKVLIATKQKYQQQKSPKFIFLPNGVDVSVFQVQKKFNSKLLYIGRFEKQKNLQFMIDALGRVGNRLISITMVGSGSLQKDLKRWSARYNVQINFVKPMENKKLASFMRGFSIFILTSYHEGSPKVLLEAMASGLVPITTDFPTTHDAITSGENGFITPFSPTEYARVVEKVIKDKLLQKKIAKSARLTIEKDFNLQLLIKKEIGVLKNV